MAELVSDDCGRGFRTDLRCCFPRRVNCSPSTTTNSPPNRSCDKPSKRSRLASSSVTTMGKHSPSSIARTSPGAFIKSIWTAAQPLPGSIAERYLEETRHIDITRLPPDTHRSLRFHRVFGSSTRPCLIALMRDPLSDKPVGIQRIALELCEGRIEKIDACSAAPAWGRLWLGLRCSHSRFH